MNLNDTNNVHILVVDDETIGRLVPSKMIEGQGFAVDTATNGEEALSMWQEKRYSLIFTDCHMPVMDGFCLAKAIRHIEKTEQLPQSHIVALTASASKEERGRFTQAGMNDSLTKPMTPKQLQKILSGRFSAKQKTGESETEYNVDQYSQLIDYAILEDLFPDRSKQASVLENFQTHLQENYNTLKLQIGKSDLNHIESIAHKMKGACKMIGVNGIANICAEIEILAKSGHIAEELTLANLSNHIRQFNAHLSQQTASANLHLVVTKN
jgi:two-component system, NarL family, sensor histidine kinase EvgS